MSLTPPLSDTERALISLWAFANWSDVVHSLREGKVRKPLSAGGDTGTPWKERPGSQEWAILGEPFYVADGDSIRAGQKNCSWSTAARWLKSFTPAAKSEILECWLTYADAVRERDDELQMPWMPRAERDAARDRYWARRAAGAGAVAAQAQHRAWELIREAIGLSVPVCPVQVMASPEPLQLALFGELV